MMTELSFTNELFLSLNLSLANATGTWSALLNGTVVIIQGSVITGFKPTTFQLPAQLFKPEYNNNADLQ